MSRPHISSYDPGRVLLYDKVENRTVVPCSRARDRVSDLYRTSDHLDIASDFQRVDPRRLDIRSHVMLPVEFQCMLRLEIEPLFLAHGRVTMYQILIIALQINLTLPQTARDSSQLLA